MSAKITRSQLVSRIAAHVGNGWPVADVSRAVEETLSEIRSLGEAFDDGRWSLKSIAKSVESVLKEGSDAARDS
ncbi:MAG: hypothetical protein ACK5U7_03260 [Bacteroidota bacterium]|jgi:hypothetical protein